MLWTPCIWSCKLPVWQGLPARQRQYPRWPASPGQLAADLDKFVEGVPCYVGEGRGKWQGQTQLFICTPTYQLLAVPSQRGDTYRVPWMKPLGLREHERLARGALLLQPVHWRIHTSFDTVPAGISNYADQVLHAWEQLQSDIETREPPLASITPAQESYLNTVGQLIEVSRRLVMDRAALEAPVGYRAVEFAAELRQTARDAYRFHLESKPPQLDQDDPLRLRGAADVRGRVLSLDGDWLTVRFETAVDREQIPEQGVLERVASDKPFKLQQEAVEMLRDGDASNPHLLPILVDSAYLPYRAPVIPPSENPPQEEAFRRSLTMPDLLLVLGPPGTGKTRTIAKIVGQHGREQRRVLVTAKTHKAVDNVLEKLPIELTTVRIGHEDRVSESTRHLLIDAQARTLQQSILRQTEAHFQALAELVSHGEQLARRLDQLAKLSDELEATETRHQAAQQRLEGTRQHLEAQHNQQRASLQASLDQQRQRLRQLELGAE